MKVLHLTTEFPPHVWGGLGRSVPGLCDALAQFCDISIIVYDYLFDRKSISVEKRGPINIIWTNTLCYKHLSAFVDFDSFDVVNAQVFFMEPLANKINAPKVYTLRSIEEYDLGVRGVGLTEEYRNNIFYQCELVNIADRFIVCGDKEKSRALRYFPSSAGRVDIIPNGIKWPIEVSQVKKESTVNKLTNHKGPNTILFVGRFNKRKGLDTLIKSFELVCENKPDTKLIVVGGHADESDAVYIRHVINNIPEFVMRKITFTGWVDDIEELAEYYLAADILVVPSRYEPFGNIVLEAFSFDTPVIASNVGGLSEIIDHDVNGILFDPEDCGDLVKNILDLLNDPKRRESYAEESKKLLIVKYNWFNIAKKTLECYQKAIEYYNSRSTVNIKLKRSF